MARGDLRARRLGAHLGARGLGAGDALQQGHGGATVAMASEFSSKKWGDLHGE